MLNLNNLKNDLTAGIVVFLVAIPLCLGIALASGASLFAGIISGIIGGIVVGMLSDSRVSVSGPAAGMIAIVLTAVSALGSYQAFLLALFIAGILQILIAYCRAGFIAEYIPSNVIQGLLVAIGILIIIKQLPLAIGYYSQTHTLQQSLKVAQETLSFEPLSALFTHISLGAMIIATFSLAILIFWSKLPFKFAKMIPGAVVVVIAAIVINHCFNYFSPQFVLENSHLVNIPINNNISAIFSQFKHPSFSEWSNFNIYLYAIIIAIVASLETLLNLEGAEKIDPHHRYSSRNKELLAQGVGNTLSGLIGGLPITSVIVRTSVNIEAGAKSKHATIFHGIFLLCSLVLIPQWLNKIPIAALATIMVYTGFKLARVSLFKEMYQKGFPYFFPFIVTIFAIVSINLLIGILIGLATSFFFILRMNSKQCFMTVNEKHPSGNVLRLILPQQVTYLNKASIVKTLKQIEPDLKVVIDAQRAHYIDNDILEIIDNFKNYQAPEKNIQLNLEGFKSNYPLENQTNFITATTYDVQSNITPAEILEVLYEGNQRFIQNTPIHKNYSQQIAATIKSQHPIAVVLSCIDSRVPVELIFDVSVGDMFVARVAGNIINNDILASMEFACSIIGVKLIMILGHKNCGAIKAACDNMTMGHLSQLIEKIKPAIQAETQTNENRDSSNDEFVTNVTCINIQHVKNNIYQRSDVLRKLIDQQQIAVTGAIYDVETGMVKFEKNEHTHEIFSQDSLQENDYSSRGGFALADETGELTT